MHHSDNHTTIVSGGVLYGFFMDIVGSLFFNQNVWLLSSLSFFSILNMLVSVKILIDMLTILSLK